MRPMHRTTSRNTNMTGVRCKELKQKLLALSPFPNLKVVVDMCRSYESSIRDCTSLDEKSLNKISKYKQQKKEISARKMNHQKGIIKMKNVLTAEKNVTIATNVQRNLHNVEIAIVPNIGHCLSCTEK